MSLSGTGGAYYTGGTLASSFNLHSAFSRHLFVRASAVPSTANFKIPHQFRGGSSSSMPHEQFSWNHTTSGFQGSNSRRSGSYVAAQMTLANLTANTWHSVGAIYDGSNLRSYLEGVADGVSSSSSVGSASNCQVDILCALTTANTLDSSSNFSIGEIAELAIWNVVLTADEIASLSKGMRATRIRPASLVYYAPFIRELGDIKGGLIARKLAGTEVIADHPRVYG